LRFWNHDVLLQSEAVTEMIFKALSPALSREIVSSIVRIPGAGEGAF
jgi:hypothetical protein